MEACACTIALTLLSPALTCKKSVFNLSSGCAVAHLFSGLLRFCIIPFEPPTCVGRSYHTEVGVSGWEERIKLILEGGSYGPLLTACVISVIFRAQERLPVDQTVCARARVQTILTLLDAFPAFSK